MPMIPEFITANTVDLKQKLEILKVEADIDSILWIEYDVVMITVSVCWSLYIYCQLSCHFVGRHTIQQQMCTNYIRSHWFVSSLNTIRLICFGLQITERGIARGLCEQHNFNKLLCFKAH